LLVASDRTVICGSVSSSDKSGEEICSQGPSFASYSLVTGTGFASGPADDLGGIAF
jgi:hypothetical protein